jgi:hypothetical protein
MMAGRMNAKTLAELALKVWGVTLIIGALRSLPGALWMFAAVPQTDSQAGWPRLRIMPTHAAMDNIDDGDEQG